MADFYVNVETNILFTVLFLNFNVETANFLFGIPIRRQQQTNNSSRPLDHTPPLRVFQTTRDTRSGRLFGYNNVLNQRLIIPQEHCGRFDRALFARGLGGGGRERVRFRVRCACLCVRACVLACVSVSPSVSPSACTCVRARARAQALARGELNVESARETGGGGSRVIAVQGPIHGLVSLGSRPNDGVDRASESAVCAPLGAPTFCQALANTGCHTAWLCRRLTGRPVRATANLRTQILDFRGFDSSGILLLRDGICMSWDNSWKF